MTCVIRDVKHGSQTWTLNIKIEDSCNNTNSTAHGLHSTRYQLCGCITLLLPLLCFTAWVEARLARTRRRQALTEAMVVSQCCWCGVVSLLLLLSHAGVVWTRGQLALDWLCADQWPPSRSAAPCAATSRPAPHFVAFQWAQLFIVSTYLSIRE